MKPGNLVGLVFVCAAILLWTAPSALARGGGGGGTGFSGGGHGGGSSVGGGGRGASSTAGGRAGMRGYAPGMRGYPGYVRGYRAYSPTFRSALNKGNTQAVYRPSGVSRRSAVRSSNVSNKSGSSHRRSTTAATNRRLNSSDPRTSRTDRLATNADSTRTGLNRGRTGDLTTATLKSTPRAGRAGGNRSVRFDPANRNRFDRQAQERVRDGSGRHSDVNEARQRHNDWCHGHHGHDWWHHHCDVIVIWDWGFWGWYDGWWYPAWGYDPYYASYEYDGPIYGYDGLPPDEAVANVQSELQRLGYYPYAADGKLGPLTQNALNRFQRDHRLPITGTIDPTTVNALGLK